MSSMWPRFFVPPPHPLPPLQGLPIHLLGVRGRGMGPAAIAAVEAGAIVDGCDARSDGLVNVEPFGIPVALGHDPAHIEGRRLVATTLISPGAPEVKAALEAGVAHHRADLVAALIRDRRAVTVTGAKGKGTVSGLVGLALAELGEDPLVLLGVPSPQLGGYARIGPGRAVVETDESDGTIARIPAEIGVVTNMWYDHAHYPRTLRETLDDVAEHLAAVPRNGRVVLGPGRYMRELEQASRAPVWRIGRDFRASVVARDGMELTMRLGDPESASVTGRLRIFTAAPAQHAALAYAALRAVGHQPEAAADALGALRVLSRRLEFVGEEHGVRVFDDHGNQPQPVRHAIEKLRALRPRRLHAVHLPHRNDGILRWGGRLARALEQSDRVVLLPLTEYMITPRRLAPVDWYRRVGLEVELVPDSAAAIDLLERTVRAGDIVCFFGSPDSLADTARGLVAALRRRAP
jgi:UDP-N-acetylmuramate--alanine ligase